MLFRSQDVVKQARKKAEKLGLGEELLDSLYALIDLPESEARDLLAKIGLMPDILEDLFPKFPETATKEVVKDIFELLDLPLDILYRKSIRRKVAKIFEKIEIFSSVTGTSASDKSPKVSTIDTVRLELCF